MSVTDHYRTDNSLPIQKNPDLSADLKRDPGKIPYEFIGENLIRGNPPPVDSFDRLQAARF